MSATRETCGTCVATGRTCTHNISKTSAQCWGFVEGATLGRHSNSCASWCECECHTGAYTLTYNGLCRVCNRDGLSCTTSGMECICECHAPSTSADAPTDDEVREAIESIEGTARTHASRV